MADRKLKIILAIQVVGSDKMCFKDNGRPRDESSSIVHAQA